MYVSLNLVRSWSLTSDVIVVNFQMQLIIGRKRFLLVVAFVMENAWKKLPFVSNCVYFSNVLWYLLDLAGVCFYIKMSVIFTSHFNQ